MNLFVTLLYVKNLSSSFVCLLYDLNQILHAASSISTWTSVRGVHCLSCNMQHALYLFMQLVACFVCIYVAGSMCCMYLCSIVACFVCIYVACSMFYVPKYSIVCQVQLSSITSVPRVKQITLAEAKHLIMHPHSIFGISEIIAHPDLYFELYEKLSNKQPL